MIRRAVPLDAADLLRLMRGLAEIEGYASGFTLTQDDLLERGFPASRPAEFTAWVVEGNAGRLVGFAVAYTIPFTYDLRPTIVLKELFVEETQRGLRHGQGLFAAVCNHAQAIDGRLLRWQVLPGNAAAKKFYRRRGGMPDAAWENWILELGNDLR